MPKIKNQGEGHNQNKIKKPPSCQNLKIKARKSKEIQRA